MVALEEMGGRMGNHDANERRGRPFLCLIGQIARVVKKSVTAPSDELAEH